MNASFRGSTGGRSDRRPKRSSRRQDLVWVGALLSVLSALIMIGLVWLIIR